MPWVRIDDHTDEHPKVAEVGPLGFALWTAGLAYCNRNLTDGAIPRRVAHTLMCFEGITEDGEEMTGANVAARLVAAGLWERDGDNYRVHDYLEFQPSREKVERERELAKLRMQQGRNSGSSSGEVRANTERSSTAPNPNPNPNPIPESKAENGANAPRRRKRREPTPAPPAVEVYREMARTYPAKSWFADIAETVGESPNNLEFWRTVVKHYLGTYDNKANVKAMLDFYGRRQLPGTSPKRFGGNHSDPPQVTLDIGDTGPASAEFGEAIERARERAREREAATCKV